MLLSIIFFHHRPHPPTWALNRLVIDMSGSWDGKLCSYTLEFACLLIWPQKAQTEHIIQVFESSLKMFSYSCKYCEKLVLRVEE